MRTLIEILVVPAPFVAGYALSADGTWRGVLALFAAAAVSLALASWSLRATGPGWRSLGLARPSRAGMTVLWGVAALVVVALIGGIFQNVFLLLGVDAIPDAYPADLHGNPAKLLLALIAIVAAAFGEELVFRGFLLDRIQRLLPAGRGGWQLAVFLGAVLYGLAHLPRGGQAVIVSGTAGLAYGAMYFGSGRSLWVVASAHGILECLAVLGSATPSPEAG